VLCLGVMTTTEVFSGEQAGQLKDMLVGEVEEARKDAEVVALTRQEAKTQLNQLDSRLNGLLKEKRKLKVWSL
jgi:hypothetical protein